MKLQSIQPFSTSKASVDGQEQQSQEEINKEEVHLCSWVIMHANNTTYIQYKQDK